MEQWSSSKNKSPLSHFSLFYAPIAMRYIPKSTDVSVFPQFTGISGFLFSHHVGSALETVLPIEFQAVYKPGGISNQEQLMCYQIWRNNHLTSGSWWVLLQFRRQLSILPIAWCQMLTYMFNYSQAQSYPKGDSRAVWGPPSKIERPAKFSRIVI